MPLAKEREASYTFSMITSTGALGHSLRLARERRGLTQDALARAVGISRRALSNIEHGYTADPAWSIVVRLAEVVGFSLDWLAGEMRNADG